MCDNKRVLTVIIGSNGAGKTTLAKKIMGENRTTETCEFGKYTLCNNIYNTSNGVCYNKNNIYNIYNNIIAIGGYTNVCGGVDTVRPLKNAYKMAVDLAKKYPQSNILMDSLLMSGLFSTPVKMYLELKYNFNFNVEICLLFANERESVRRVYGRNGNTPINTDIVCAKLKQAVRNFTKLSELGEFNCFAIDTSDKTQDEVFVEFKKRSRLYR